jgi:hypothetical protein
MLHPRIKYPRTAHLSWSPGYTGDDVRLFDERHFSGKEVVVSEKNDGENTTIYADGHTHARSIDSRGHKSRNWVRQLAKQVGAEGLAANIRVTGENLYARHSIAYNALPSYFMVFGIYEDSTCLSWDETVDWCSLLGLYPATVLYRGMWDEAKVKACWTGRSATSPGDEQEGYVVRVARRFDMSDFGTSIAKFVRSNHVQTSDHWMHSAITPNKLCVEHQAIVPNGLA